MKKQEVQVQEEVEEEEQVGVDRKQPVVDKSVPIESYSWVIDPQEHKKGLAISNYTFINNTANLDIHGFGAVISVFGEAQLSLPGHIIHLRILVGDTPTENIKCFFETANKFISQHISTTNILIHCKAGVSRSATITAAYLMKTKRIGYSQVMKELKEKRSLVYPNKGFQKQLKQYDRELVKQREEENCMIY